MTVRVIMRINNNYKTNTTMNTFKTFAIAVALLFGAVSVNAQTDKTFSFIDAAGNEVVDGSNLTFYAEKVCKIPGMENKIGYTIQANFALNVRNNTNATASVALKCKAPENPIVGEVQICFPEGCDANTKGEFITGSGLMKPNEVRELDSEWVFGRIKPGQTDNTPYGTEDVSLTIMNGTKVGPTVHIRSIYADPTGITDIDSDVNAAVVGRYDANGRKIDAPQKGINIVKLSNGKTIKTVVK